MMTPSIESPSGISFMSNIGNNHVQSAGPILCLVDDEENNLLLFSRSLKPSDYDVRTFRDGREFLDAVEGGLIPDLVLSDVMMPRLNGYQVCEALKSRPEFAKIPVVLVTGLHEIKDKVRGLEAGADDFLHKPFHPLELRARVKSLLRIKAQSDQLERQNRLLADSNLLLEERVRQRTIELEELTIGLTAALERANTMNDEDTGNHIKRVCHFSELFARALGLDADVVVKIGRFASLHDVGKVGIPDSILKKPGSLTPDEWEEMKRHTLYGYELLRVAGTDRIAQNIALCHHEKFDGTGYPYGLKGDQIPIEARIVALADVYDALTNKRCYKDAYSEERADAIIRASSGKHFDPDVVEMLFKHQDEVRAIKEQYRDVEGKPDGEVVTMDAPPAHLLPRIEASAPPAGPRALQPDSDRDREARARDDG
ncbi:MAG: response regulator [Myxococcales bacterium]|nr:response regulator [Myxococcales bacterium]